MDNKCPPGYGTDRGFRLYLLFNLFILKDIVKVKTKFHKTLSVTILLNNSGDLFQLVDDQTRFKKRLKNT